jgi:hypothetical protein
LIKFQFTPISGQNIRIKSNLGFKLTNSEGDEVLWFGDFALVIQKSGGSELFGFVPEVGVHVDGVQERDDLSVFGDLVAVENHVPENTKTIC